MSRWWWLVMLAACGDNAFFDAPHSGTRLHVAWYRGDDGSEVPTGSLYDGQLAESCFIESWTDGVARCTRTSGYVGYQDAACTRRLVVAGVQGDVASDFDPTTCAQASAWVAGAALAATQWYEKGLTGCMGPYTASQPLLDAEKEIDPNTFVVMATTAPLGDGRLRSVAYTSTDGFRMIDEYRDSELAVRCYPGSTQCDPDAEFDVEYLDAACTQRIVALHSYSCIPPLTLVAIPDPVCSGVMHYHRIGALVPLRSQIYQRSGDSCALVTPSSDVQYRAVGEEVAPAQLATATESVAGRRLQRTFYAGDGIAAPSGQLLDTQLGTPCSWQGATDGTTRCLPVNTSWYTLYTDTACTQGTPIATWTTPQCTRVPLPQYASNDVATGVEIHPLLGRHTATLYQRNGQTCDPVAESGLAYYDVDPRVVDPASFAQAQLVLEP